MDVFRVTGNGPLKGTIEVGGAKNAALPILAASLLTEETVRLENVPDLSDIRFMVEIMRHVGARVESPEPGVWEVTAAQLTHVAPYELVRKMRASVCLLGPLVGRLRRAEVSIPGGCVIGPRPIDLHLKGLAKLNCKVSIDSGYVHVDASDICGGPIFLGGRSGSTVTGTANIAMAAVLAPGTTRIECAACEPEVVDLCNLLVKMGAHIEGIGSPELTIHGVKKLHGCKHSVIADRIEAGTFLLAAAITRSPIRVEPVTPEHLSAVLQKLRDCGCQLEIDHRGISITPGDIQAVDITTQPFPGFPTDLQAPFMALMTTAKGTSVISEKIYENRLQHVAELQRMGASIRVEGSTAIVEGVSQLSSAPVTGSDLRAAAAMVLAGLAANGTTKVSGLKHLDRGYDNVEAKLNAVGAQLERQQG